MKAIIYPNYGSPDILQLREIEKPVPEDNQVLVKIQAAAANPLDWHRMRGAPFLVRMSEGFLKPKNVFLGADIAGRVEAVGSAVTQFKPGDEVFGCCYAGGFAEYVCVTENTITLKPARLSFESAASIGVAALTALQGLRDAGKIQPGQNVLVNGASGGVGTFAVQLAKAFGAKVTGVCSTRNVDLVHSLGAAHVVDYTRQDFTRNGQQYDLLFDTVGNHSASAYHRALSPQGICVVAGFSSIFHMLFQVKFRGARMTKEGGKKIGGMGTARTKQPDLVVIKEFIETGKVVPVIDRCYPLNETAEAIRYLETGRARGKVVITVPGV